MAVSSNNPYTNPTKPQDNVGPYDDPAYKKLSRINGDINKMTKDQMKEKLANLHLDTRYYHFLTSFPSWNSNYFLIELLYMNFSFSGIHRLENDNYPKLKCCDWIILFFTPF